MSSEHTAYIETLAHVNCGACDSYWGLSDISKTALTDGDWTCPHCGAAARIGELVEE